ncbi:MAG: hypothetical protein HFH53_05230 [Hespellia sp.]|nr:hypothetical protein [Hespellia sp.]
MNKKILIIGPGNIGRALIGNIFYHGGYDIIFYGVTKEKVDLLKKQKEYLIETIHSNAKATYEYIPVYDAVHKDEREKTIDIFSNVDLVACPIYSGAFDDTCKLIADGIRVRCRKTDRPQNILLVVNELDATEYFREKIGSLLSDDPIALEYMNHKVGFPLSLAMKLGCKASEYALELDKCAVATYRGGGIHIDKEDFIGDLDVRNVKFVHQARIHMIRKIWCGNMVACLLAFMGSYYGLTNTVDCAKDERFIHVAKKAIRESIEALTKKYRFLADDNDESMRFLLDVLDMPVNDSVYRVTNRQIKKLSHDDRFIGPALMCYEQGIVPENIAIGIAYGFKFYNPNDAESIELNDYLKENGLEKAMVHFCGLPEEHDLIKLVRKYYDKIEDGTCLS